MLSRHDGENNYVLTSHNPYVWNTAVKEIPFWPFLFVLFVILLAFLSLPLPCAVCLSPLCFLLSPVWRSASCSPALNGVEAGSPELVEGGSPAFLRQARHRDLGCAAAAGLIVVRASCLHRTRGRA
jgi:hypothetical protein